MPENEEIKPDHYFISLCRNTIQYMKNAGLNDVQISVIVTEIRSAAVNEEFFRTERLRLANPPNHFSFGRMMDAISK